MRECMFQFVGEEKCGKPAKATIGVRWYCAEHYDEWMAYYQRVAVEGFSAYAAKRLKEGSQ